jgi:hypothetical protein
MSLLRRLNDGQRRSILHWAMELVVVVAGVLIALWLQQWVEQRRAVATMHTAEGAIHDEIREALEAMIWRQAISQCHFDRANRLKTALTNGDDHWPGIDENTLVASKPGGRYGAPTVFPSVYQRPVDSLTDSAWNSALTTGALAPMDRDRFGKLVAIYDQIRLLRENREIEDRAATRLSPLGFPMRLTPEARIAFLQALYDIDRTRFAFSAFGSSVLAEQMRELGWNDKAEIDQWLAAEAAEDRKNSLAWLPCVAQPKNPFDAPAK